MGGVVHVDIGELVLRGFAQTDASDLAESVAAALADRFSDTPEPVERRDSVAEQIAQAVFEATRHA